VAKRDDDLRSPNFLDVAKYPRSPSSRSVSKQREPDAEDDGDLTIRGVTKEVVLTVEAYPVVKDPWGTTALADRRPRRSTGRISGWSGTRPWRLAAWWWETRWRSPSTWRSTGNRRSPFRRGTAQPQLRVHINAALNVGVPRTQIVELFMQIAVYAGIPRRSTPSTWQRRSSRNGMRRVSPDRSLRRKRLTGPPLAGMYVESGSGIRIHSIHPEGNNA